MFNFWTKSMRLKALERQVIELWSALSTIQAPPAPKLVLKPSRKPKPPYAGPWCAGKKHENGVPVGPCRNHVKDAGMVCRYHRTIVTPVDVVQSANGVV